MIVGDSIGAGAGVDTYNDSWMCLCANWLEEKYNITVNITNISMHGNSSYAGYVRVMQETHNKKEYDLAILCYGQNDEEEDFAKYYDALVSSVRMNYKNISIISILESSQRKETLKIKTIKKICDYYNVQIADTIQPFNRSQELYDSLTDDGIHPNKEGQKVYFKVLKSIIEKNVEEPEKKTNTPVKARYIQEEKILGMNEKINSKGFVRVNDVTYVFQVAADLKETALTGIMGIDYTYGEGRNSAQIYLDKKIYTAPVVTLPYDVSMRHILVVNDNCTVKKEIKVVFETKKQADGFKGLIFSNDEFAR